MSIIYSYVIVSNLANSSSKKPTIITDVVLKRNFNICHFGGYCFNRKSHMCFQQLNEGVFTIFMPLASVELIINFIESLAINQKQVILIRLYIIVQSGEFQIFITHFFVFCDDRNVMLTSFQACFPGSDFVIGSIVFLLTS